MDLFRADLHLHSRFSRATSKGLNPRHLAAWAHVKGISLLGTGDFTHPGWLAELKEQLVPEDTGLFRLAKEGGLTREIPWLGEVLPKGRVRYLLQAEISSIYSQGGKVRKIHNLVFVPSFAAAERLNERLARVGNLSSDGRPILGLPAKDLLAMVLDLDPGAFLVPAHVWTPWFSLFGSKSGFEAIEECFGDLSSEIFALETGLSSDPAMNRLWSALDRFRLISNSDAHSGEKLGREAKRLLRRAVLRHGAQSLEGRGPGAEIPGHGGVLPRGGQVPPGRPPQVRRGPGAPRDQGQGRALPRLRQAADRGRAPPGDGSGRPRGARYALGAPRLRLAHPAWRAHLRGRGQRRYDQGRPGALSQMPLAPRAGDDHSPGDAAL